MVDAQPLRLEVDGEVFDVATRPGVRSQCDFTWVSGPNLGYGFSSRLSEDRTITRPEMVWMIRDFLAHIDPDTGYLD
jgi:hypothetical protein